MAATQNDIVTGGVDDFTLPPRKKPKVSELPLSSTQRSSIDGMLHTFKKKGEFDGLRKKTFQQYNESAQRGMFEASLRNFTGSEIERDAVKYLKPDRRIAAPLLEGAAARAEVYLRTEEDVDKYLAGYMADAERKLRVIRIAEIGEEAAAEEARKGVISDDVYAEESEVRRQQRAKKFEEDQKKKIQREKQERKKKELAALKKKQEALMQETEKLQRDQKRRAEREAWKQAEKDKEKERIRLYNEKREREKKEQEEREKAVQEEKERREKEREAQEQKRLEEEALELLLQEGKRNAEKSRRPEYDRSESMEPPPRMSRGPSNSFHRDDLRAQGLMPTSLSLRKTGSRPSMSAVDDPETDDRRRPSRMLSPSPGRSSYARRQEPAARDDDRHASNRRETSYRDSHTTRPASRERGGEEGEVVERPSTRARSRSVDREAYRRRLESRSPPRRRDRSRVRSPPRRSSYRERDYSPAPRDRRRRSRSRSPAGIDRYIPGGGSSAAATTTRRTRDDDRDRDRDREERQPYRASDKVDRERDERERERDRERARYRERDDDRRASTRDDDRRRSTRYDDRPKPADIDRYVPGVGGRGETAAPRSSRRDRSPEAERSGARDRSKERERNREGK